MMTMTTIAMDAATENFVRKMRDVEREAALAHGPFNLFGLFEREDTPGRWDVVVSALWLPSGRDGFLIIAQYITSHLTPEEAILVARIVSLPPESGFVRLVNQAANVTGGDIVKMPSFTHDTADISQGYVLASRPESVPQPIG